jgi:hypothetical protein
MMFTIEFFRIRKPSGFCGIFKVSKRDLALTFALSRSDVMSQCPLMTKADIRRDLALGRAQTTAA